MKVGRQLCSFCLQPLAGGENIRFEQGPPSKYWNSITLALPVWHSECSNVAYVWMRYRGLMTAMSLGEIKASWKHRRVVRRLAKRFYELYEYWTEWFVSKYSEARLSEISGRWRSPAPVGDGPYR